MPTDRATDQLGLGIPINKDVVRRIPAARYQPAPDAGERTALKASGIFTCARLHAAGTD
jgi:hypothetical protein